MNSFSFNIASDICMSLEFPPILIGHSDILLRVQSLYPQKKTPVKMIKTNDITDCDFEMVFPIFLTKNIKRGMDARDKPNPIFNLKVSFIPVTAKMLLSRFDSDNENFKNNSLIKKPTTKSIMDGIVNFKNCFILMNGNG